MRRRWGLPMLDRMYKEYPKGEAPEAMEALARKIVAADGFLFVTGEYNWGMQPGLKNLTDHFLESGSGGRRRSSAIRQGGWGGARSTRIWHGTLSEMGMVVISSTVTVGGITSSLDEEANPVGDGGEALDRSFPRFAADLEWWAEATKAQRARKAPPY